MADHEENRRGILQALHASLVGPNPMGEEIDCSSAIDLPDWSEANGPYVQKSSREEILLKDSPRIQYGVGVLYPIGSTVDEETEVDADAITDDQERIKDLPAAAQEAFDAIAERNEPYQSDVSDDLNLSDAHRMQQGCIGLSFLCLVAPGSVLTVKVTGGRYKPKQVHIASANKNTNWWLREPVEIHATFTADQLLQPQSVRVQPSIDFVQGVGGLDIKVEAFSRPVATNPEQRLITVAIVNRTHRTDTLDAACLFQSGFKLWLQCRDQPVAAILPYPEVFQAFKDEEELGISLLYRKQRTYGIGHGCAADWSGEENGASRTYLDARCLPTVEVPSTSSTVARSNGSVVEVPMALLAGLQQGKDGFAELEEIVSLYEDWITERKSDLINLPIELQEIGESHLTKCYSAAQRMKAGLEYLRRPEQEHRALKAFRLANHAILLQQANSNVQRTVDYDPKGQRLRITPSYQEPDIQSLPKGRGKWRAFQIAFVLLALSSVADSSSVERDVVELIWFPTGGGKTEAYLGLAAFDMFLRRIDSPTDCGVQVLMRYTLRLLTAQQFQRAAGLICAMDFLRRKFEASTLGETPFSIGIWVGGDTTPNNYQSGHAALAKLKKYPRAENPFLITRCPWCGAYMGPLVDKGSLVKDLPVVGYLDDGETIRLVCPDVLCEFNKDNGLPIYVLDDAIYRERPSLVIGTVDKFAQLTWKSEARRLFGIGPDGSHEISPPGLIIQDELHLIAGPLGSMVGFYESLIEELCTDRRGKLPVKPKIVCSTATIRRYSQQIKALYNRDSAALFPPPGLDAGDSFFARYARNPEGGLLPGKVYVGVHAPALGSMLTCQVRVNSALLQAPVDLTPDEADPWWTLLIFYNSIRELGGALTLFQSDIRERLNQMRLAMGRTFAEMRQIYRPEELTSRLRNDEVPEAIRKLQEPYLGKAGQAVDVCLASNIIEVGVDIDRLSLMSVVGQPKTTNQYIQVTGRVGRRADRPGVIVTIYNPSKPRDRSHFEKFRSYHETLYAQVEPTSVTPFSPPLLDRALHALMVAYVRQRGTMAQSESPYPCPESLISAFWSMLRLRTTDIDPAELFNLDNVVQGRANEWRRWLPGAWKSSSSHPFDYLLRPSGEYVPTDIEWRSWATPTSLRNVDSECQAQITQTYLNDSKATVVLQPPANGGE
jgi:hypothetical protein